MKYDLRQSLCSVTRDILRDARSSYCKVDLLEGMGYGIPQNIRVGPGDLLLKGLKN